MTERKINLEEILKQYSQVDHGAVEDFWFTENVIKAMKEACRQTLELAAENATVAQRVYNLKGEILGEYNMGQEAPTEQQFEYIVADKQSILNTINQIE